MNNVRRGRALEELGQKAKPRKYNKRRVTWGRLMEVNINGRREATVKNLPPSPRCEKGSWKQ